MRLFRFSLCTGNRFLSESAKERAVAVLSLENDFGDPAATCLPPNFPAPGPNSRIQSAFFSTWGLCSITIREWPASRISKRQFRSLSISSKCKPVVGSSISNRQGSVPFAKELMYLTNLSLCDSPPESVLRGCPKFKYPRPTLHNIESLRKVLGSWENRGNDSSMVRFKISWTDNPSNFTCKSSSLNLLPSHCSHGIWMSERNCISTCS